MRTIEFKSKIRNNSIHIPKKVQSELRIADEKNVRVMIFLDEDLELKDDQIIESNIDLAQDELESINRGLKDFEEGKIHANETARKLYEKYL